MAVWTRTRALLPTGREGDSRPWRRRQHFELLSTFDHPHFNMCANLELTAFHQHVGNSRVPFTVAFVHMTARAANAIPEFRLRIRAGRVVEHKSVSPSVTILVDDDLFSFCTDPYCEGLAEFADRAIAMIARVNMQPTLENEGGRDNLLYMTALPWVSFTCCMHPMQFQPRDCIPRLAWGRFFQEGESLKIPLSVQCHHALTDGIHMAKFYAGLEDYLLHPEDLTGRRGLRRPTSH